MAAVEFDKRGVKYRPQVSFNRSSYTVTSTPAITTTPVVIPFTEVSNSGEYSYDGTNKWTRQIKGIYMFKFQLTYTSMTTAQDLVFQLYDPDAAEVVDEWRIYGLATSGSASGFVFVGAARTNLQVRVATAVDAVGTPTLTASGTLDIYRMG